MKKNITLMLFLTLSMSVYADNHGNKVLSNATVVAPNMQKGRLLASNCFQCHNTLGIGGFERLSGASQLHTFAEVMEKRLKNKPKEMNIHAKGYTKEQLWDVAGYLASIQINQK